MRLWAIFVCVLGISAPGLAPGAAGPPGSAERIVPPPPATDEDRIAREVRHVLVTLPDYSVFDYLGFTVNGHTVTLTGQVTKPTLKSDAERAARQVEGVEKVENKMQVLPAVPMDDRIRLNVYRAIYGQPGLDRYAVQAIPPIHIIVEQGNVTLAGVVDSQSDKELASIRANSVSGVFSVTNNLRVEER